MSAPFVFARLSNEDDAEFPTLRGLAEAIVRAQRSLPGAPAIAVANDAAFRGALPAGRPVSIRALDGAEGGRGTLIGYAFMPGSLGHEAERLMDAIWDVRTGRRLAA